MVSMESKQKFAINICLFNQNKQGRQNNKIISFVKWGKGEDSAFSLLHDTLQILYHKRKLIKFNTR